MPNFANRVLQGNGTGVVEAGLPQHTHNLQTLTHFGSAGYTDTCGWSADTGNYNRYYTNTTGNASNSIYGKSTTVQPPACKAYMIIKY